MQQNVRQTGTSAVCGHPRYLFIVMIANGMVVSAAIAQPAFRAFWADAIYEGLKTTVQIDNMVNRAVQGRYNAIVAQVKNYEAATGYFGAYWESDIVPKSPAIAAGLDPLDYLCQKAHAAGLEVHAWLVAYRISRSWPPTGNNLLAGHPEWFTVSQADMGSGPKALDDGGYYLDPGSTEVQEHLISIVQEIVTRYPVDGIHWDYIRYTQKDSGYPADVNYSNSGLARYRRITGFSEIPLPADPAWSDFRRQTVNELVRRCRAEVPSIRGNPRQPLRVTAALFCPGGAPTDFRYSTAYDLHQNWKYWLEMGWLDAAMPMNYKDDSNATHAAYYRSWIDAVVRWRSGRHAYCGQGNYLNTMTNSLAQMQYVLETAGADGVVNYSYYSTTKAGNDWTWYPYIADKLFTSAVPTPSMPWRDPATATEGTLWGRITDAQTGVPLDNAMIQTGGSSAIFTDGNGYYVMTRLPAAAGGTCYTVTASRADYAEPVTHADIQVIAGEVQRADLALSSIRIPADFDNDGDIDGVDLRHLVVCLSGAGLPPISPECQNADLDKDNDVDQSDFATLQRCLSGNGTPVTTECQTR